MQIATLVGNPEHSCLHRDPRVVRQLVEAVALCHGAASPSKTVPASWVPLLRRLAAARNSRRSWRAALAEVGLEAPDNLTAQKRAVRGELSNLWDSVLAVTGLTVADLNDVAEDHPTTFLRRLLA